MYLAGIKNYAIVDDYLLVHAGLNLTGIRDKPLEKILELQCEDDLHWIREEFYTSRGLKNYTIVFGHTPTTNIHVNGEFSIWHDNIHKDKICIDCGAYFGSMGGRLACMRLEDRKEYYVE